MPAAATIVSPGVYLDAVIRTPEPAFETGVPVFLGALAGPAVGPPGDPLFRDPGGGTRALVALDVLLWSQLEARLGVRWAAGYLGFAVRGFFENGGVRCHVAVTSGDLDATLDLLEPLDGIDLICAPDLAGSVAAQQKLVALCDRRGDCFAILDAPASPAPTGPAALREHRNALVTALAQAAGGGNAALYAPWVKVRGACPICNGSGNIGGDPQTPGPAGHVGANGATTCQTCWGTGAGFVPPSGHVAGVYARTDRSAGIHKAPANEELSGVLDLQLALDSAAQATLHPLGVNCLRAFPGRGMRVWGARTLSQDPAWIQVNVRRLVLTIARWLSQVMAGVSFEPNNLSLWARIGREVSAFLDGLFEQGALQGATAREAYFVKCDDETNPQEARDAGLVVTEVGVAPARPSEFIVVRLVSGSGQVAVAGT